MSRHLATLVLLALAPAFSQDALSLPSWFQNYPGVNETVHSTSTLVESSYTAAAEPAKIVEHYRRIFETASLAFHPNFDGMGTSIRAEAHECDLLIQIRERAEGSFVHVNCSAKIVPQNTPVASVPQTRAIPADMMERHRQVVAEMGIHRQHHDAPAPPLVWPSWLVHVNGAAVRAEPGVDQAKNAILKARYTTNIPMTEIYSFYRELLNSHEYPARSSMSTGQTITGIQQNATGRVEGFNYPDGAPGAYSVISISFDRHVLNGPITVSLRFTTHEYIASRGY
jgi:hypothetical protein